MFQYKAYRTRGKYTCPATFSVVGQVYFIPLLFVLMALSTDDLTDCKLKQQIGCDIIKAAN